MKASCSRSKLTTDHWPLTTSSAGFTLVEVLFSLFFLTIGVFGVYALIVNNQRILEANKNFASALMLGEQGLVIGQTLPLAVQAGGTSVELIAPKQMNDSGIPPGEAEQSFTRTISQCGTTIFSKIQWTDTLGEHKKVFSKLMILPPDNTRNVCTVPNYPN